MNINPIIKYLALTAFLLPLFAFNASAAVIYVNASVQPGGDGTSWKNAYNDFQLALQQADDPTHLPDIIMIAAGTYKPGTQRTDAFIIPDNTAIFGGFGGETILSGDLSIPDIKNAPGEILDVASHIDNSYHVVTANNVSFMMYGLTIYGGYNEANGSIGQPGSDPVNGRVAGAGLNYINGDAANAVADHNTIVLDKIIFKDNYINGQINGNGSGGGASIQNPNAVNGDTLEFNLNGSTFTNNHSGRLVAAIAVRNTNTTIQHTAFESNRADNPFSSNSGGGGASISADANVPGIVSKIEHSSFTNNRAGGGGGSLNLDGATTYVNHTDFINNSNETPGFAFRGGAIFSSSNNTYISHCLFNGNSTTFSGGAIVAIGPSALISPLPVGSLTIDNTKFVDNYTAGAIVVPLGGVLASIGGAIADFFVPMQISNSTFENNEAKDPALLGITPNVGGGAISTLRSSTQRYLNSIKIENTQFINNKTPGDGGAFLDNVSLNLQISDSKFTDNSAGKKGGAIFLIDKGVPVSQITSINRTINIFDNHMKNNIGLTGSAIDYIDNTGTPSFDLEILTVNIE
jgi:hypothetical protein